MIYIIEKEKRKIMINFILIFFFIILKIYYPIM